MRRNQTTIIHLRDQPLYPRPSYSSRHLHPIEHPRSRLSTIVVAGALLYCIVYLVTGLFERPPVTAAKAPPHVERAQAVPALVPVLTTPDAPAPDMSSEDVRFAAADADAPRTHPAKASEPEKLAAKAPPRKKRVHIVAKPKEQEQDGWQAFAFSFAGHRTQDGGF